MFIAAIVGLTMGNFLFQALKASPDFMEAAERSFFQLSGIAMYILLTRLAQR